MAITTASTPPIFIFSGETFDSPSTPAYRDALPGISISAWASKTNAVSWMRLALAVCSRASLKAASVGITSAVTARSSDAGEQPESITAASTSGMTILVSIIRSFFKHSISVLHESSAAAARVIPHRSCRVPLTSGQRAAWISQSRRWPSMIDTICKAFSIQAITCSAFWQKDHRKPVEKTLDLQPSRLHSSAA